MSAKRKAGAKATEKRAGRSISKTKSSAAAINHYQTLLKVNTPKGESLYIQPADVLMAESSGNHVKILVYRAGNCVHYFRHCLLHDFEKLLPAFLFLRVNRFYIINLSRLSSIDGRGTTIWFNTGNEVQLMHHLSANMLSTLAK
jgi:DNA-binding LytR/AlgR family response regulator